MEQTEQREQLVQNILEQLYDNEAVWSYCTDAALRAAKSLGCTDEELDPAVLYGFDPKSPNESIRSRNEYLFIGKQLSTLASLLSEVQLKLLR